MEEMPLIRDQSYAGKCPFVALIALDASCYQTLQKMMGFHVVSMPTTPDTAKIWELKRIKNKIGSNAMLLIYAAVQPHTKGR